MLAAVLWLGNVSFSVIDNENHVDERTSRFQQRKIKPNCFYIVQRNFCHRIKN